jgi:hypothetical protein
MEENTKNEQTKPDKESLLDKAKKLADKADDFLDEKVGEIKETEAFKKVASTLDKAEDYVEERIEDIKQSGVKEKLEELADKTENKAEEALSKLKEFGKKASDKTADKLEEIAKNIRIKSEEDKKSENT